MTVNVVDPVVSQSASRNHVERWPLAGLRHVLEPEQTERLDLTAPEPWLGKLLTAGVLLLAAGASLTLALQVSVYDKVEQFVGNNAMDSDDRTLMLGTAAATGLGLCLVAGVYLLVRRSLHAVHRVHQAACILSPLTLSLAVPYLFNWRLFQNNELGFLVLASVVGLLGERTFRLSLGSIGWHRLAPWATSIRLAAPRLWRWIPALLVLAIVAGFGLYFSYYTMLHHYRVQTQSYDLAIFDNMMWHLVRGEWFTSSPRLPKGGSHIAMHATFVAYLLAPVYALWQRAETLLVLQAVLAGLGIVPVYLLAKRRLASAWIALAFAYCYAIYAPLHGPIFYDFHFLLLAPLFVGWTLYFFETRRRWLLLLAWFVAVLVREEMGAGIAMACLFYLLAGERPRWALAGGLVSGLYFVLIKFIVMPAHIVPGESGESFTWVFSGLIPEGEKGFGAILRTVVTNPLFVLKTVLVEDKLNYVLRIVGPLLFLPLRHRRVWILVLFPFAFTMLSTGYKPVFQTSFQYTAHFLPYVFLAAIITLGAWRARTDGRIRIAAAMLAMLVTATAMSYQHGAIFQHNTFRGGFRQVKFEITAQDRKNHDDLYKLIAMIPKNASVAATETEAPHVSARDKCYTMRSGYEDADYLLFSLDEVRGWHSRKHVEHALKSGKYGFIESAGNYALWGRGKPTDRNEEGAALVNIKLDES